jgi:hemerythrin
MPFMEWNEKLSVGVAALDDDHKKLIEIINQLHDGIEAGHKKETLGAVLDHLEDFTSSHLPREEELLVQTLYKDAVMHKWEHANFVKQIQGVRARFTKAPSAMLDLQLMSLLQNWMLTHLQGSDRKYVPHLKAGGIS